ncbi:hypothetical protein [Bacillus sp. 165]|uniref:hypothetical protein n=1 Tax=Bacillus sp. 165 TaxID=1529117 RepID=UPI001AD97A7A|nr:hypothetical protein [Bacillus sp. 165]MBO9128278.1 hypothetical protein [Bacillus sp. 165]
MSKKQKQTIHGVMKKSLRKEYFYLKRDLLLFSRIDFGKLSTDIYYATFDKDGISIYQYSKSSESRIKLLHRHPWSTWKQVTVDHYLTKSEFVFKGDPNWIISIVQKGKAAQAMIEQYTSIEVEESPRPVWRKIPGYRSFSKWNMLIGSIFYSCLFLFLIKLVVPYLIEKALFSISIAFMLIGGLCFVIGLIDPTIVLPKVQTKTREKVFFYYGYLTIVAFISVFLYW